MGLTQEQFAESIGLTTPYYGRIERGSQNVTLWNFQRVAAGLNAALSALLREAETLDLQKAIRAPHSPPRVGRPKGRRSGY